MAETLAAGDLTTAFSKWLTTIVGPKNENVRKALNTNYVTTYTDIAKNVTKFLHDRA